MPLTFGGEIKELGQRRAIGGHSRAWLPQFIEEGVGQRFDGVRPFARGVIEDNFEQVDFKGAFLGGAVSEKLLWVAGKRGFETRIWCTADGVPDGERGTAMEYEQYMRQRIRRVPPIVQRPTDLFERPLCGRVELAAEVGVHGLDL